MTKYKFHKNIWILRLIIVTIIPLIISFGWLFPINEKIELSRYTEETVTNIIVAHEEILKPSIRTSLINLFGVPFNLNIYNICFEDVGSYATSNNIEQDTNITWIVEFNNENNITILPNSKNCEQLIKSNEKFTYNWQGLFEFNLKWNILRQGINFHPNTLAYAIPEKYNQITKNMIFFISWISLCWLISRILKLIKFGIYKS